MLDASVSRISLGFRHGVVRLRASDEPPCHEIDDAGACRDIIDYQLIQVEILETGNSCRLVPTYEINI